MEKPHTPTSGRFISVNSDLAYAFAIPGLATPCSFSALHDTSGPTGRWLAERQLSEEAMILTSPVVVKMLNQVLDAGGDIIAYDPVTRHTIVFGAGKLIPIPTAKAQQ